MAVIQEFDTIAAISTAVSNAGIGIVRMSGAEALAILARVFLPHNKEKKVQDFESHRIYYGNIVDGEDVIDECLVLIMREPASYTKEDVVEIDCHGGVTVIYRILKLLLANGARAAEPGEFTKRAFLNGRIDLSQAEAVMDLIDAKNETARENSLSQLKGGLSEKIRALREEILYQVAFIESALDDPEHYDLAGYPETLCGSVVSWLDSLEKMVGSYDDGRLIAEGVRTCIVGKPNAGKSSFLNALLGEERAIVTDIAGTTRDTLEETVTIDGITLRIVDTAGIRKTEDKVESIGVEKARREIAQADLILLILDTSVALSAEDLEILAEISDRPKMILLNKSDQRAESSVFEEEKLAKYLKDEDSVIAISAKYGNGMEDFISELKKKMFHGKIDTKQDVYITNARHKDALEKTLQSIVCVKESIESGMPEDFFTIDMMNAYEKLGQIIGESVEDDLVNKIFSQFCTGK